MDIEKLSKNSDIMMAVAVVGIAKAGLSYGSCDAALCFVVPPSCSDVVSGLRYGCGDDLADGFLHGVVADGGIARTAFVQLDLFCGFSASRLLAVRACCPPLSALSSALVTGERRTLQGCCRIDGIGFAVRGLLDRLFKICTLSFEGIGKGHRLPDD